MCWKIFLLFKEYFAAQVDSLDTHFQGDLCKCFSSIHPSHICTALKS